MWWTRGPEWGGLVEKGKVLVYNYLGSWEYISGILEGVVMKVLVTGNNGYIGNVMCPMLKEEGFEVFGLDTNYFDECEFIKRNNKAKQIIKDIRQIDENDFIGIDFVIHLAGLSNDPMGDLNPGLTEDINLTASIKCAQLAKKAGVKRFVFASSCSVYGVAKEGSFVNENGKLNPVTAYAKSKIGTEEGLHLLADNDFSPVLMRNSTVYGSSPLLRLDLVVNNLTAWGYTTGKLKVMSDGSPWRPLIHIRDFSQAFIAALKAPQELIHDQVFNVGQNQENYQVSELANIIKEVIPNCQVEFTGEHGADTRSYRVDFTKINTGLKGYFKPVWNVRKGVEQLAQDYKKYDLDLDAFQGKKYIRLKQLNFLQKEGRIDKNFYWVK